MLIRACAAAVAACLCSVSASFAQPLPASAYSRLPAMTEPAISPDGSRIAALEHSADGSFVVIRDASDFTVVGAVNTGEYKPRDTRWAGDGHVILIFTTTSRLPGVRGPIEFAIPMAINADDLSMQQLMRPTDRDMPTRIQTNMASIKGVDPDSLYPLLAELNNDNEIDLFVVDPANDRRERVGRGAANTVDWVVDARGEPIARMDWADRTNRVEVRVRDDGGFYPIVWEQTVDIPEVSMIGPDGQGNLIMGLRLPDVGRYGLYPLSMETGRLGEAILLDEEYDIGGARVDPYTNRVIGGVVYGDTSSTTWFDPEMAEIQALFDSSLGGATADILSWSKDRSRLVLSVSTGEAPTIYYVFDRTQGTLKPVQSEYPEVYAAGAAPRLPILYRARDDVQIPAYLTIPDDLEQPAPLVVLPHGGPESLDVGGFDWLAHFIASRGYAVLQPNFRGSEGFGDAWRDAGRGGWGTGVMQHDVTDGVDALVEAGIADPDNVCIVGASYGGYAALAGAVFTPDLYRCVAAFAPVTDLNRMISYERDTSGAFSYVLDYWRTVMGGDVNAQSSQLSDISPINHTDAVRAPILLIHGRDDSVVPIAQSRRMESALQSAGADVQLIDMDSGDHWLSTEETRRQMLEAIETFLAEHMGG